MIARFATVEDMDGIGRLIEPHIDLLVASYGGYDRPKAEATMLEAIETRRAAVVDDDGEIVGTIGMAPFQPWHGDQTMLTNLWLYIVPGCRSFAAWRMLVAVARSMAEEADMPLVLSFEAHNDVDRKHRLFGREGQMLLDAWSFVPKGGKYRIPETAR